MSSRQGPVVHKFGGSVLADAAAFRRVSAIVHSEQQSGAFQHGALLVISACAGVTDRLLAIAQAAAAGKAEQAEQGLQALEQQHLELVTELGLDRGELQEYVRRLCAELAELCRGIAYLGELTLRTRDAVLGYGELLASAIVAELLRRELPVPVHLVDARRVLLTDYHFGNATPMIGESGYLLQKEGVAGALQRGEVVVTQGFIGATPSGIPTTLGRGGSDYSAAAFARALEARELQLWKDVPGICTADPRRFPEAQPVAEISYAELQELARFGSKVVHPHAISPAVSGEIPVRIRSVFAPQQPGTLVWHRRYDAPAQPLALAWRERCMAFRWYPKGNSPLAEMPEIVDTVRKVLELYVVAASQGSVLLVTGPSTGTLEELYGKVSFLPHQFVLACIVGNEPSRWTWEALELLRNSDAVSAVWTGVSPVALYVLLEESAAQSALAELHGWILHTHALQRLRL